MVAVTSLGRLLDPVQRTETLNLKTKRNSSKNAHWKKPTHISKRRTQSTCRTGPDIALTVQGIQSWSTGYDPLTTVHRQHLEATQTSNSASVTVFLAAFCHFWSSLSVTTKLNPFHMVFSRIVEVFHMLTFRFVVAHYNSVFVFFLNDLYKLCLYKKVEWYNQNLMENIFCSPYHNSKGRRKRGVFGGCTCTLKTTEKVDWGKCSNLKYSDINYVT